MCVGDAHVLCVVFLCPVKLQLSGLHEAGVSKMCTCSKLSRYSLCCVFADLRSRYVDLVTTTEATQRRLCKLVQRMVLGGCGLCTGGLHM